MNAIENLKAVLCGPEGKVAIHGSDKDREIIQQSLKEIEERLGRRKRKFGLHGRIATLPKGVGTKQFLQYVKRKLRQNGLGRASRCRGLIVPLLVRQQ